MQKSNGYDLSWMTSFNIVKLSMFTNLLIQYNCNRNLNRLYFLYLINLRSISGSIYICLCQTVWIIILILCSRRKESIKYGFCFKQMLLACHLKNQSLNWIIIILLNRSLYFYHWLWVILNTEADHISPLLETLHCHPILLRVCSLQNSVIWLFFLLCIILSFLLIGPAQLSPGCTQTYQAWYQGLHDSCSCCVNYLLSKSNATYSFTSFRFCTILLNVLMEKPFWIIAALSAMHTS